MKHEHLKAYQAVMAFGTMTLAAEMIASTQPGISRMISQLEREIGFKLFEKVKGKLQPTHKGRLFYQEVENYFVGINRLTDSAKNIREDQLGELIVACLPALSSHFLPSVIEKFIFESPDIKVSLLSFRSEQVRQMTVTNQCDLGIAIARESPSTSNYNVISMASVCILPPHHPLCEKDVLTPSDLKDEKFISFSSGNISRFYIDRLFVREGIERKINIETSFSTTICSLVLKGLGVSIVDPISANGFAPAGLVVKPLEPEIPFEISILYPSDRPKSSVAISFEKHLLKHIDELDIKLLR